MIIHLISFLRFLLPQHVSAITLWPFIVCKYKKDTTDAILINHERIHLRQQLELLVIPFYVIYLVEYLYLLVKLKNHQAAYLAIRFEKEAYQNEANLNYLDQRKSWSIWR